MSTTHQHPFTPCTFDPADFSPVRTCQHDGCTRTREGRFTFEPSRTEVAATRHAENLADWLVSATADLVAQAKAKGLSDDETVAAVQATLLAAVAGR